LLKSLEAKASWDLFAKNAAGLEVAATGVPLPYNCLPYTHKSNYPP
jgi:hypothetical protein